MNQPHKHKKSGVCCFIQVVLLLTVLAAISVGLVYYFGADQIHSDIPHALDQIFNSKEHQDLIVKLSKKAYQHAVVWGANQTGIFQFLEHYADTRASKSGLVIVRRVQNNIYQTALKFIRFTKDVIEENINLETQTQKVEWIFLVRNGQIPLQEIQKIQTKRTKDRILIGLTSKPTGLKGFKKVQFPEIPLQFVKDVIVAQFGISNKQADILTRYYASIPQIVHHLDQISYTHEKHLGEHYQNLKDLGKKQLNTLKVLCKKGVAPAEGNKAPLEEVGVALYDGKAYWEKRINRLNYQLSQLTECKDQVVSLQIATKIAEQKQQQSREQIQAENQVEQAQPVATKDTKKAKQPQKPKKQTKKQSKTATKTQTKAKDKKKSKSSK